MVNTSFHVYDARPTHPLFSLSSSCHLPPPLPLFLVSFLESMSLYTLCDHRFRVICWSLVVYQWCTPLKIMTVPPPESTISLSQIHGWLLIGPVCAGSVQTTPAVVRMCLQCLRHAQRPAPHRLSPCSLVLRFFLSLFCVARWAAGNTANVFFKAEPWDVTYSHRLGQPWLLQSEKLPSPLRPRVAFVTGNKCKYLEGSLAPIHFVITWHKPHMT